jgi:ubiquinone/menaquinone biosynthesis C-methylase UbiE
MKVAESVVRTALKIAGGFLLWQIVIRVARKKFHFPAPAFIGGFLDSEWRRMMQPPRLIIERSGIRPGMRVLEIGCGSGGFTTYVARAVEPRGEVAALDIQPAMLEQLRRKLAKPANSDITNVGVYEHSAYDLPFADSTFDVVYLITVLQEIPDRPRTLAEARRVLKPDGRLAVSEFLPDPDYVPPSFTARAGEAAGFKVDAVLGNLWSYTVRFRKSDGAGGPAAF